MGLIEILILSVGLAMDAFAVAICKGLSVKKLEVKHAVIVGLYFGGFQGIMPLIGYFLGSAFASYITKFSHWITFGLLVIIGINMIRESFDKGDECECTDSSFSVKAMLPLAVATSIDAMATGVVMSIEGGLNIFFSVSIIAIVTFIISAAGVKVGNVFGTRYKSKAEFVGGCVLILLGIKFLLEGLNIINF